MPLYHRVGCVHPFLLKATSLQRVGSAGYDISRLALASVLLQRQARKTFRRTQIRLLILDLPYWRGCDLAASGRCIIPSIIRKVNMWQFIWMLGLLEKDRPKTDGHHFQVEPPGPVLSTRLHGYFNRNLDFNLSQGTSPHFVIGYPSRHWEDRQRIFTAQLILVVFLEMRQNYGSPGFNI